MLALTVLNDALIAAVMALGVNMMWGYAGLFNIGISGFFALGGLAVVLVSNSANLEAWNAGTPRILLSLLCGGAFVFGGVAAYRKLPSAWLRVVVILLLTGLGWATFEYVYTPAVEAVEAVNPASAGNIGGMGLPVPLAWFVGAGFAAFAAWVVAKIALGLRSDYLAIATLGIGQIIISVMKNEIWLDRGVKDVYDLHRWPVPKEVNLQNADWFIAAAHSMGIDVRTASALFVGICFALISATVLVFLLTLAETSLNSPWGRMMRAIRDNEVAAEAMGKDVKKRHLQIFVLGSAVVGIGGALYAVFHGIFSPHSYDDPLRYTFLIWAMVILGGSGNNFGSTLGALVVMLIWIQAESLGPALMHLITAHLSDGPLKSQLINSAVQIRLPLVGIVLIAVLRFSPRGLLPERSRN
nr:branched-chain amino acid ABC transporter permease [Jiella flava]